MIRAAPVLIVVLFVALGSLWIDWPGLECDEARFVVATYPHNGIAHTMHLKAGPVPLMVVSYMGALKSWLYIPILKAWPGSPAAVRLPAVLIGAAALYLFYLMMRRALGRQCALVALILAATDPIYLFTARLDWGPVAIQHLCLMAGCLCVLRWVQHRRSFDLALGFFMLGVGVFDKAPFLWLLAALALSVAAVFPRQLWASLKPRFMATAAACFLLGSAPFVYYCWKWPGETFRVERQPPAGAAEKFWNLVYMLRGTALVGWISNDIEGEPLEPPDRMAAALYAVAPRQPFAETLLLPAVMVALLALPGVSFAPWGRAMIFALLFTSLVFLEMLPIAKAGWVHHLALFLPFPQLFVAAAWMGLRQRLAARRWSTVVFWSVVVLLAAANLRAVAHHYFRILGYGGGAFWSEAIYPLAESLEKLQAEKVVPLDWGMHTQLQLLSADRLRLHYVPDPSPDPRAVYVKYGPGHQPAFPQMAETFFQKASRQGYRIEILEMIRDRRGRPIFEILTLR